MPTIRKSDSNISPIPLQIKRVGESESQPLTRPNASVYSGETNTLFGITKGTKKGDDKKYDKIVKEPSPCKVNDPRPECKYEKIYK